MASIVSPPRWSLMLLTAVVLNGLLTYSLSMFDMIHSSTKRTCAY